MGKIRRKKRGCYFSDETKRAAERIIDKEEDIESPLYSEAYCIYAIMDLSNYAKKDFMELETEDIENYIWMLKEEKKQTLLNIYRKAQKMEKGEQLLVRELQTKGYKKEPLHPADIYQRIYGKCRGPTIKNSIYQSEQYTSLAKRYLEEEKDRNANQTLNTVKRLMDYAKKDFFEISPLDIEDFINWSLEENKAYATVMSYIRSIEKVSRFIKKKENGYKEIKDDSGLRTCFYQRMPQNGDLVGMKFGQLKVERKEMQKRSTWMCRCSCGNMIHATTSELLSGRKLTCGDRKKHPAENNISGRIRGDYKVLYPMERRPGERKRYMCECRYCNERVPVQASVLTEDDPKHNECRQRQ